MVPVAAAGKKQQAQVPGFIGNLEERYKRMRCPAQRAVVASDLGGTKGDCQKIPCIVHLVVVRLVSFEVLTRCHRDGSVLIAHFFELDVVPSRFQNRCHNSNSPTGSKIDIGEVADCRRLARGLTSPTTAQSCGNSNENTKPIPRFHGRFDACEGRSWGLACYTHLHAEGNAGRRTENCGRSVGAPSAQSRRTSGVHSSRHAAQRFCWRQTHPSDFVYGSGPGSSRFATQWNRGSRCSAGTAAHLFFDPR